MNREIKFRAFDDGKMIYQDQNILTNEFDQLSWFFKTIPKYAILMQYTGLHDRFFINIYEGDIIKIDDEFIETIQWVDESNWMDIKCPVNGWVNHQSIYKKPIEVIGNIYDNPELLNDKD